MKKLTSVFITGIVLALVIQTNAFASGGVGVGAKVGTLGFGVDVTYPVNSFLTVGVGINKYSFSKNLSASSIDYKADLNWQTAGLFANIHPFAGSFHITGALMQNNNELKMTAKPDSSNNYTINGQTYSAATLGTLDATVDFKKIAPYAGIGWGSSASTGLGFTFDIGVMMQGKPKVDLSYTGSAPSDPNFQSNLKQEESNAENDIKDFTIYPVISAGIDFRF
jgi:hypothetical protein